jgi:hypothetical protein
MILLPQSSPRGIFTCHSRLEDYVIIGEHNINIVIPEKAGIQTPSSRKRGTTKS